MPRLNRLDYSGAFHHIMSRGNRKMDIFKVPDDRAFFLKLCSIAAKRYNISFYSICLMTNHYHFIVKSNSGRISLAMQYINGCYAQYFNRKYNLSGHLFQGRFKAVIIRENSHLLEATRYILLNPVRADIVSRPEQYHWSSYNTIIKHTDEFKSFTYNKILSLFNNKIENFISFINDGIDNCKEKPSFYTAGIQYMKKLHKQKQVKQSLNIFMSKQSKTKISSIDWQNIAKEVCKTGNTYVETGKALNISPVTVKKYVVRYLQ